MWLSCLPYCLYRMSTVHWYTIGPNGLFRGSPSCRVWTARRRPRAFRAVAGGVPPPSLRPLRLRDADSDANGRGQVRLENETRRDEPRRDCLPIALRRNDRRCRSASSSKVCLLVPLSAFRAFHSCNPREHTSGRRRVKWTARNALRCTCVPVHYTVRLYELKSNA